MRNLLIIVLLLQSFASVSQISMRQLPGSEPTSTKPVGYDSVLAVVENVNPQKYVGQEIYFLPKQLSGEPTGAAGYKNIFSELPKPGYPPQTEENTYKLVLDENEVKTNYTAVAGKYFKVLEVIDKSNLYKTQGGGIFLKLESKENKDIFYLQAKDYDDRSQWPYCEYIIAGAFAKLQQLFLNNTIYVKADNIPAKKDLNKNEWVKLEVGDKWLCTDVTLTPDGAPSRYLPTLFLKNDRGNEIAYKLDATINIAALKNRFLTQEEKDVLERQKATNDSINAIKDKEFAARTAKRLAEDKAAYIKQYGEKNGTLIANGQVAIGMNKEMCVAAWGRPTTVNTTTTANGTRDQYVYRDTNSYLYFENGKLVTIQK